MKPTTTNLIRWTGLAALVAGIIFAAIQPIHPPDVVASVTTSAWAVITPLKWAMCLLFLLGIAGLYARQVEESGWLGLAGALLLGLSWGLQTGFVFAEAFVAPPLAAVSPGFVDAIVGISYGHTGGFALGALPALYSVMGVLYMLGGLVFGLATFRAGVLPRWPAGLLAVVSAVTPAAALLPHHLQRLVGMPVGLALAWLGFALWVERRAHAVDHAPGGLQVSRTGAD
ncbi:MAG: hypothetical protein ACTHNK_10030 [Thermomicrobiales bacterium]|nr:hypothetical protein [Thermomicrobiales bacterium]